MQYYPFDSRNPIYRSKIGAVASNESLRLRLLLHNDAKCFSAFLQLKDDRSGNMTEIPLTPAEWCEDYRFWDCEIKLEAGLYWYAFRYQSEYGEFFVTKCSHSTGHVSRDGAFWQQTVYDSNFTVPNWLDGGIIYQIFPDRFYNSGTKKCNVPKNRYIVDNWQKQPEYTQNDTLCTLGNDYYGGDLKGITKKLPYLSTLGVTCIYLNPIFEAHSNHRYNTADYLKIDPLLGTQNDLKRLCSQAKKHGIRVILDGVFSHTGDDSIYFNRYNRYDSVGAYNSENSPYYGWFKFENWPSEYSAWWGVPTLPETEESNPDFNEFITGKNGVLRYWMRLGISGWRLDVADELPDEFIKNIRTAIKQENPDAFLLGEVWEDASNKISYGSRRQFLLGYELDSVMNYPFANAIIEFVKNGDACKFVDTILDITENYPPQVVKLLMNHIGTHDTPRILTRLGFSDECTGDRHWQSQQHLNSDEYQNAVKKLKLAAALQYTVPGVPSLYYGDEAGCEGFGDPFCRGTYPWGNENTELLEFYRTLGNMRRNAECLKQGEFIPVHSGNGYVVFMRKDKNNALLTAVNITQNDVWVELPEEFKNAPQIIMGQGGNPDGWIKISSQSATILKSN